MRAIQFSAMFLVVLSACSITAPAADSPQQNQTARDFAYLGQPGPSVCERQGDSSPLGQWFISLAHSLCQSGDADSLLAAYLISLPTFGAHGEPDHRLLGRAYAVGKSNPTVLWVVATDENCQPIVECRGHQRAVDAAKTLTRIDPGNAMAWFALAYAEEHYVTDPDEVALALAAGAKAPRVHDYGFDLLKLVAVASGRVPIPDAARDNINGVLAAPESLRWGLALGTTLLGSNFAEWIKNDCSRYGPSTIERKSLCAAAKSQLKRGDSLLTLSQNPQATAAIQADMQRPSGESGDKFSKAIIDAILQSDNEQEMFAKAAARLRAEK